MTASNISFRWSRGSGGTIDKFVGDEIVALFGAPVAHENDAERACAAALEMMAALADLDQRKKADLGLHFGINTGHVSR